MNGLNFISFDAFVINFLYFIRKDEFCKWPFKHISHLSTDTERTSSIVDARHLQDNQLELANEILAASWKLEISNK